ncbi:MAG: hypothetical protein WD556_06285 [Actinomycetota bacterium]
MGENRYGVAGNVHAGVFFTELTIPQADVIDFIRIEISRQNAHLGLVKDKMAQEANRKGAVVIQKFRYGQRAHKWWQQAFTLKWDSESWYGEGQACAPPNPASMV